jgi:dihydrofolate reductase
LNAHFLAGAKWPQQVAGDAYEATVAAVEPRCVRFEFAPGRSRSLIKPRRRLARHRRTRLRAILVPFGVNKVTTLSESARLPDCPWDGPLKARFNAAFQDIDTILLSRKIQESGYLDHWSQFAHDYRDNHDFTFAKRIVDTRKVVFSKTLQEAKWAGTEFARRPLVEEIDAIKTEPGRDMIAFGGADFASSLTANDLVDEH